MVAKNSGNRSLADEAIYIAHLVFDRKWLFLFATILTFALAAGASYLVKPRYTAVATVLPSSSNSRIGSVLGQLGALSGLAGISVGDQGVDLYPMVGKSQTIFDQVFAMKFRNGTVLEFLLNGVPQNALAVERVSQNLRDHLLASKDLRSSVVRFEYTHPDREFSAFFVNALLAQMDLFFRASSGFEAKEQREMIELRLSEVAGEAVAAEDELQSFRLKNRAIAASPVLLMDEGRLMRQVEIKNRVYMELAAQLEVARIQEAGSVSVLRILDRAQVPQEKSWPKRSVIVLLALVMVELALVASVRVRDQRQNVGN